MAKRLQHQISRAPYESNHPGCMWGLLHFLDLHQRLRIRKMLANRRHHDGERPARRIKIPKTKQNTSSAGEEHDCLDKAARILMEDKVDAKPGSSTKARMRNLLSKRKSREQDQMRQISPLASRLLRTISIHHLESHDYVLPDELTFESESSTAEVNSDETDSSASREHEPLLPKASDGPILQKRCGVCGTMNTRDHLDGLGNHLMKKQLLLREKLTEAREALSKQKGRNARELGDIALQQSKEFLDMMELFNANRELFLQILQDQSFMFANYLQGRQASSTLLSKSGSFPVAGLSGRKNNELFRLEHKRMESEPFVSQNSKLSAESSQVGEPMAYGGIGIINSETAAMDSAGTSSSSGLLPGSPHRLKNQKGNGTVSNRFKAIKQRIKDVIKENRKERHRVSMDGILHKIPYGHKVSENVKKEMQVRCGESISYSSKYTHKSIRRSHSLTESLDKYSRLLDSISSSGSKRLTERSNLMQEAGGLQGGNLPKALKRIVSLPELESYSSSKDFQIEVPNRAVSLEVPKPATTLVHMEENMNSDIVVGRIVEENASGTICGGTEQPVLIDDHDQCDTCSVLEDLTESNSYIPLHEQEIINELDPCDSTAELESYFQEDPVSPANDSVSEDPEIKLECIHFEELDSSTDPQSQLVVDSSDGLEGSEADFDKIRTPGGLNPFHVQVDQKDEADFNYVREILWKSGFSGEEFLGAWYSQYQPVDPLLFEEAEGSSHETDITGDESDMSLDHQLLFDLINEILLEIYGTSFAYCPWLSRFDSRIRPMPVGHHVLEEVWANISWCLSYRPQLDPTIDYVVARDYAKSDGWMNLQSDTEDVGFELEDMILDDLLDEVVLQL